MKKIEIYDTTLRDGSQAEDVKFSTADKIKITKKLDELGVDYIEGGWPKSNTTDNEYFKEVKKLDFKHSVVVAFGSTHKAGLKVSDDPSIKALLAAGTKVVTIFGKTWDFHVKKALRISLRRNLELIRDTILYLKKKGVEKVFFDAEHFFDGFKYNPKYAKKCLLAAEEAGADRIILCDTNGGILPSEIQAVVKIVSEILKTPLGIHTHNDGECAVANSLMAVSSGAIQVQGTINGVGERCGNANLASIIPNLQLKLNKACITPEQLTELKEVASFVYEVANLRRFKRQPFVGDSAFAHKGGIHASAVERDADTYEHIRPELVGNSRKILASELAGRSNVLRKAKEFGVLLKKDSSALTEIFTELKDLENQGFEFEAADASFELLMRKKLGSYKKYFKLLDFGVTVIKRSEDEASLSEATIMVEVDGHIEHTASRGDGPVNALDQALRKALEKFYPELKNVKLADYKVRVLTNGQGTANKVRVLIESGDGEMFWGTVGVDENIIQASWQALVDSIEYYLLKKGAKIKL